MPATVLRGNESESLNCRRSTISVDCGTKRVVMKIIICSRIHIIIVVNNLVKFDFIKFENYSKFCKQFAAPPPDTSLLKCT